MCIFKIFDIRILFFRLTVRWMVFVNLLTVSLEEKREKTIQKGTVCVYNGMLRWFYRTF